MFCSLCLFYYTRRIYFLKLRVLFYIYIYIYTGPGVAKWLRRCATSRKVPGSIAGGLTRFFSDIFPYDLTMSLGSTQPLVKINTRNIPGGKGVRCVRLTSSPSRVKSYEIWEPKPSGTLWATPGLFRDSFKFILFIYIYIYNMNAANRSTVVCTF
jgi:hypothetical protein